jgi:hypothetical protein
LVENFDLIDSRDMLIAPKLSRQLPTFKLLNTVELVIIGVGSLKLSQTIVN